MWCSIFLLVVFCSLQIQNAKLPAHGQHQDPEVRIVNGTSVIPHSAPFVVSLLIDDPNIETNKYLGGGSLISSRDILTAAHNLRGSLTGIATLGVHDWTATEDTQQVINVNSSQFIFHPSADVAIIRVPPQTITINDNVKVIGLPSFSDENTTFDGEEATFYGWGLTHDSPNSLPNELQKGEVHIITHEACSKIAENLTSWDFCTHEPQFTRRGCSGDSGGPLLLNSSGVQVGVVRGSIKPCDAAKPTIFTRTSLILKWIQENSDAIIKN